MKKPESIIKKGLIERVKHVLDLSIFVILFMIVPAEVFSAELDPVFGTFENQSHYATENLSLMFTYRYFDTRHHTTEDITSIEVPIERDGRYVVPAQNLKFRPWIFSSKRLAVKVELFSKDKIIGAFPLGEYFVTDYSFQLEDKEAYQRFHEYFKYVDVSDKLRDFTVSVQSYNGMSVRQYLDEVVKGTKYQDLDQFNWFVEARGHYVIAAYDKNGRKVFDATAGKIEKEDGIFSQSAAIHRDAIVASWDNDVNDDKTEIVLSPTIGKTEYSLVSSTLLVPQIYKDIRHEFHFAKIGFEIADKNTETILDSVYRGLDPRYGEQTLSSSEPLETIEFIFRNPEEARKWL